MKPACLMTIKKKYKALTKAEKRVAEYILKNSDSVMYISWVIIAIISVWVLVKAGRADKKSTS